MRLAVKRGRAAANVHRPPQFASHPKVSDFIIDGDAMRRVGRAGGHRGWGGGRRRGSGGAARAAVLLHRTLGLVTAYIFLGGRGRRRRVAAQPGCLLTITPKVPAIVDIVGICIIPFDHKGRKNTAPRAPQQRGACVIAIW